MATVGAIYAEIRATTSGLRRDMADAVTITKQGTESMSQILDQFGKPVFSGITESARRLKGPVLDVDSSLKGLAKTSRGLIGPLTSELGPAFDGIGIRIAHVLTTSASLSSGMGALAIAAAGLAGVIGGTLATAWKKSAEEASNFQSALNSMDTTRIQGEIDKLMQKLDEAQKRIRFLQGPAGAPPAIPPIISPDFPFELGTAPLTGGESARDKALEDIRRAREQLKGAQIGEGEARMEDTQKMIDQQLVDADKAERARLEQLQEFRFQLARKAGQEALAEVERTLKEDEKARQGHDADLAKLENDRVQRNFAA